MLMARHRTQRAAVTLCGVCTTPMVLQPLFATGHGTGNERVGTPGAPVPGLCPRRMNFVSARHPTWLNWVHRHALWPPPSADALADTTVAAGIALNLITAASGEAARPPPTPGTRWSSATGSPSKTRRCARPAWPKGRRADANRRPVPQRGHRPASAPDLPVRRRASLITGKEAVLDRVRLTTCPTGV